MASVPWEVVEVGVAGYAVLRPSEPGNEWPLQQTVWRSASHAFESYPRRLTFWL